MREQLNQPMEYEEAEINLLELLQVIARRKMVIIKMCTAALIASVCLTPC